MVVVSVIIPVLGDFAPLEHALTSIGSEPDVETIVVNGGPETPESGRLRASWPQVRWVNAPAGRGRQMNAGARLAVGAWLLFLHADTTLAPEWTAELRSLTDVAVLGGSFRFRLASASPRARLLETGVRLRVRWFNLPYGDQALFVRRDVFHRVGGYREIALMEDVALVRQLAAQGRLHHSALPALTSARRWERDGWLRRSVSNVVLLSLYFLGVSPDRLARWYRARP